MFLVWHTVFVLFDRVSVRACIPASVCASRNIVNTISFTVFDTFYQTYTNDAIWDRDACFKIWGQKVKGQGHSGITYAGTVTF